MAMRISKTSSPSATVWARPASPITIIKLGPLHETQVCMLLPQMLGQFVLASIPDSLALVASRHMAEIHAFVNPVDGSLVADKVCNALECHGAAILHARNGTHRGLLLQHYWCQRER